MLRSPREGRQSVRVRVAATRSVDDSPHSWCDRAEPNRSAVTLGRCPRAAYGRFVRFSGRLSEEHTLASADHLCWVHDDPAAFTEPGLHRKAPVVFAEAA